MGNFGFIAIFLTMLFSGLGGALILGSRPGSERQTAGERLLLAAAAAAGAALFILAFLLLNHDYRIAYVQSYADRNMGTLYLITAVWGGQAGSLLFWAVLQTWYTAAVVLFAKEKPKMALGFLAGLQIYFFALVLFHSNPFEPLGRIATTGNGMNPLLLNPYMAFHPPTLFLGFVGFSVPAAYVFATLAAPPRDDSWVNTLRPFILFAWLFLSIGNLLGMVWAYQELGWGGYWGWDPVENASFMPWLTATALVHTSRMQKPKRLFRLLNPILMVLTFALIVFGTFITRSGVIASVHAFSDATVGPYLLGLIVFMLGLFTILAISRRRNLTSDAITTGALSRETLFMVTAWILMLCAAFVWIGTMAPLFTELLKGEKVASTPAFFNQWMVPLGMALFTVLAVCLIVGKSAAGALSRSTAQKVLKRAATPAAVGVLTAVAGTLLLGRKGPASLLMLFLLGTAATGLGREIRHLFSSAKSDSGFTAAGRRRLGAHVVHLSVVLLFFGFLGSAYTEETSRVMKAGDRLTIGDYQLVFNGLRMENDYRKFAVYGDIDVSRAGSPAGIYSAARMFFHSHPNQPTSEVAIRTALDEDLFLILGNIDEESGDATIRAVINPLVAWIWIGGIILVIGTLIGLPKSRKGGSRNGVDFIRGRGKYLLLPVAALAAIAGCAQPVDTVLTLVGGCLLLTIILLGNAALGLAKSLERQ